MENLDERRWTAVRERRPDPSFVFAVRTTRIACRPGCPSRTPTRENVTFFESFALAAHAGYRACKRCAPDDVVSDAARRRLIARACALLDDDERPRIDDVARAIGLSRFHFQRTFRLVLGITPGEYARARRDARLRERLASGDDVTTAMHAAGFGSSSAAYGAKPLGMAPSVFRRGGAGERLTFAIARCSLGFVLVAMSARGVCAIELGDDEEAVLAAFAAHFPRAERVRDDRELGATIDAVVRLVDDPVGSVSLELDVRGTAFQRRVWNALRAIAPGEPATYASLARAIGSPGAAQAVGAACAANRLAVAIPCHRVVREDGSLAGYRWGIERKRALLEREQSAQRLVREG
jgi:AraC family transcriptional regulator of adaptative response/methylated-DNA-[protein]-cysteine methyltransferase